MQYAYSKRRDVKKRGSTVIGNKRDVASMSLTEYTLNEMREF